MKTIPTYIHGVLDYVVGLALLLAPNLFGFADEGGAAVMVPRVIGVMILGMAVLTRYELGLFKLIPMPVHLAIDYVVPLILAASPWLFGFNDRPANVWAPHLVVGLGSFLVALMTEREPRHQTIPQHAP
ncbi:MAG TPA: SPW repeat protein [Verrucomicrobiae bacterium]|nr:SPW repeat protein [Verrucomicrobiae bacterium]